MARLVIPGVIGIVIAGMAIGAAFAYFSDGAHTSQSGSDVQPPSHRAQHRARAQRPRAGSGRAGKMSTAAASPTSAEGHRLNDEGYALLGRGQYAAAVPPLREAVSALVGTGPADPYEAYANYILGLALLRSGRCSEAAAPLEVANRLETNPAVDRALREARACMPQGS